MTSLKQYLVLHEDSMYDRIVKGVFEALWMRAEILDRGIDTSLTRVFMKVWLQSPLSGENYDSVYWKFLVERLHDHYDGVVLWSGRKLERWLTPRETIEYAFVVLRQRLHVKVLTDDTRASCFVYPIEQAPFGSDVVRTEFFGLSEEIQEEVKALHALGKALGV